LEAARQAAAQRIDSALARAFDNGLSSTEKAQFEGNYMVGDVRMGKFVVPCDSRQSKLIPNVALASRWIRAQVDKDAYVESNVDNMELCVFLSVNDDRYSARRVLYLTTLLCLVLVSAVLLYLPLHMLSPDAFPLFDFVEHWLDL